MKGLKARLMRAALSASFVSSGQAGPPHFQGDGGLALYRTPAITASRDKPDALLPYLYADYGAWYARVDTVGYKFLPVGKGHVELAARASFEGYRPSSVAFDDRSAPLPIGLGTFQETPYGAFLLYAFRDAVSSGTMLDVSYAVELDAAPFHVYPQIGFERRSAKYVKHLYGISAAEAARAGVASYFPGSSVTPNVALAVEYELTNRLKLTAQIRKRWLDRSIYASALVNERSQSTSLLALTRTFR